MKHDDWRLLFETEKSIIARRLRALFGGIVPRRSTPRKRIARKPKVRHEEPLDELEGVRFGPVAISGALHLVLLALLLPALQFELSPREEPPKTHELQLVQWKLTRSPEREPVAKAVPDPEPIPETKPEPVAPVASTPEPVREATPAGDPLATAISEIVEPAPSVLGVGAGSERNGDGEGTSGVFGSRGSGKQAALASYGGNSETEWAVSQGLAWLARHQDRNGSWDPAGFSRHCQGGPRCTGPGAAEFRVGLTALVTLAFLGAGATGEEGKPYAKEVSRALAFLLVSQDDSGCFGREGKKYMYNHALATFAIAEAYVFTGEARYGDAVRLGLTFSAEAQQAGGGWDYTELRTLRNDLSVTGWQIMAIECAREGGIPFAPEMESEARRYLARAVDPDGVATYADSGIGEGRQGIAIAAVGMLGKLYLGWSPRSHEIRRAAERILKRPPRLEESKDWERTFQSSYYWYYATLALFHVGGDAWEAWNSLLKREVLGLQAKSGERLGSFEPDPNWIGAEGGRVATTALNVLTFEVFYRYKPLFKKYGIDHEADESRAEK